jgi:hypothetical protein
MKDEPKTFESKSLGIQIALMSKRNAIPVHP